MNRTPHGRWILEMQRLNGDYMMKENGNAIHFLVTIPAGYQFKSTVLTHNFTYIASSPEDLAILKETVVFAVKNPIPVGKGPKLDGIVTLPIESFITRI